MRDLEPDLATPRGLVYVSDTAPGISRRRRGRHFVYHRPDGSRLDDSAQVQRIRSLAIPPAYTQVWICQLPRGHLQATGRDARGRKQYRYHAEWRKARDAHKFDRMIDFARALPRLRAHVKADLARPIGGAIERETVLAGIVRLLDTTLVRVGNETYARENGSYGLTTLRGRHAAVRGSQVRLRFRGKSGVEHEVALDDPRVARVVRRCQALPGQALFQYLGEDGAPHSIDSADVNDYLRRACGADYTAKDFRTWHASVHALALARAFGPDAAPSAKSLAMQVLTAVAGRLGNTVAVCRKSYVHPVVLDALLVDRGGAAIATSTIASTPARRSRGLSTDERAFVAFITDAARTAQPLR